MKNKQDLLKKVGKISPEISKKYGYILDQWWKVPEEEFVYALSGMRIYTGIAMILWLLSGVSGLATLIFFLGDNSSLAFGFFLALFVFVIAGYIQFSKSNVFKEEYEREKTKFDEASTNKPKTDHAIIELSNRMKKEINQALSEGLEKINDFKDFEELLGSLSILNETAIREIKDMYYENKVYTYNLLEQNEIESFQRVDNYITYELETSFWYNVYSTVVECKNATDKKDSEILQQHIEKLQLKLTGKEKEE